MKIIQISDTHIRNLKYHDIYRIQFEKIYKKLKELKPDKIVIVGDTIDNFVNITNECKLLTGEFLTNLSNIAPIIITYGNHECMKANIGRVNSIRTIVQLLNNKNIKYLGETGFYEEDDVIWVNYAHLDKGKIDPWDDVNIIVPKNVDIKPTIGLFHDPIYGCVTDTNMIFNSDSYKHISFFNNNSYLFAGDIHKFQYLREDKTAAYSSSTIQNNYGETPYNHGFIEWNIKSKTEFTSIFHDIPNEYNFINLTIPMDTDYDNLVIKNPFITPYSDVKVKWNDYRANMGYQNEVKIKQYIKNKWGIDRVKFEKIHVDTDINDVDMVNESINILDSVSQRKIFVEYLESNKYSKEFIQEILNIDDIINGRIELEDNNGNSWEIKKIKFSNFKSYGDDIEIDFSEMNRNSIIQVAGLNKQGKTTILDAISYILYGVTSATTKREKAGDARYINNKRELDDVFGSVVISVNGEDYTIYRKTTRKWNKSKTEITSASTVVEYNKGDDVDNPESLNEEQKKDTQKFIESTIGTFADFQRLVHTDADNLNSALSMDRSVFTDNLIRDCGLEIFEYKLDEFKEYKKSIISKRKTIDIDFIKSEISNINYSIISLMDEISNLQKDIDSLEKDRKLKRTEKELQISKLDKIDDAIESLNIVDIESYIESEQFKIEKNKERLELLVKLKKDIEDYDSSKLDNKQNEIDDLNEKITKYKVKSSNYDNDILKVKNNIKGVENDIKNIISDYTTDLISTNKDYNLEISKIKEVFGNHVNEYTNGINTKLSKINNELTTLNNQIDMLINDGKKLKTENDEIEGSSVCITCKRPLDDVDMNVIHSKVEHNKNEIEFLRSQILELRPKSKELEEESSELNITIDKLKQKDYSFDEDLLEVYNKAKSDIKSYKDKIELNIQIKEQIEERIYPNELKDKIITLSENISEFLFDIKKISEDKIQLENKLEQIETKLLVYKDELKSLKDEKESIDKKKEKVGLEPRIQSEIDKSENLIEKYNNQIEEYKDTLDKIESNKVIQKEIKVISIDIEILDDKISEKNHDFSSVKTSIKLQESKKSEYETDIVVYDNQKKEDEVLNTYMKCVHRDGLPTFLLKKSVHIINEELSKLLSDVDFSVYFDDDLNFKLSSNTRMDVAQNAIESSGMERTFTAVALKIALRKVNNKSKPNIILLDEIMGKLVEESVDIFITLLDAIKNEVDKLIIIEHIHPINYDVLIEVEKDLEGVSSLKISK